ncbi:hypothetical protein EYV94_07750 [Puteibacter caeruleilacunae]|nr:hypothetical protein EYV94_07750 [Puteibacter caeruleilacunae]
MKLVLMFAFCLFLGSCINQKGDPSLTKNTASESSSYVLKWTDLKHYINEFNKNDEELYVQNYPNSKAAEFLKENIPYFECPDKEIEKTYYFRWWTYRKHIKKTSSGFVITEFLPNVPWAGVYNTINCPAAHHFYEGRWLHDTRFLSDYAKFWFRGGGDPRKYSFWAANSILSYVKVINQKDLIIDLLPDLVENYQQWENIRLADDGLFWQSDNLDGMEVSIGGSGKRATINSYMYGDAVAISSIANMTGNKSLNSKFKQKADMLKSLICSKLWDGDATFFKTLPSDKNELVGVRELHGYTPWYFNIPDDEHAKAWRHILLEDGFKAPYGPTSAEQRHPDFKIAYEGHECQWNGPSWPFATSVTLKAMANLLRDYKQNYISKSDFLELLQTYSKSQRRINEKGEEVCWIDENLNPHTGDWLSRTRLKTWKNGSWSDDKGGVERGKDYNHSAFCDFIISDLIGIRPSFEKTLTINPLITSDQWEYFCLDHLKYHDHILTVVWDADGNKYQKGKGFFIYVDNILKHHSKVIEKTDIVL